MNKLLFTLFCICTSQQLFSQTIRGKVTDGKSAPMSYVSCVLLDGRDSSYVAGTVSGTDGSFELSAKEGNGYLLKMSYLGYKTKEIRCKTGDLGTIMLEEDGNMLGEVEVKGERPLLKMENGRLTYDVAGIRKNRIVSNAHELLKELPSVISLDGNTLNLVGATSTTIIISGKISHLDLSQITDYLKSVPAEEVEKVEVIYNAPPQWHVNGAVINVVLKKKKTFSINGQLKGNWTNKHANSFDTGGSLFIASSKWNFDIVYDFANTRSLGKTETSGIHTLGGTLYDIESSTKERALADKHSVYTNIGYSINKTSSINLSYNGLFTPKSTSSLYSINSMFSDADSKNDGDNYLHNINLSYSSQKGITAGVEYTSYENSGTQDMNVLTGDAFARSFSYWRKQSIDRFRAYIDMSHRLKHNWTINYGASYNNVDNVNSQRNDDIKNGGADSYNIKTDINEHTGTAYLGFQKVFWNGKLSVNASLSGEIYKIGDYEKNALLPNVGITFVPSQRHIVQFSYNSLRTYPSYWQRQDYTSYDDEYSVHTGNPLLKPARISNFQLAYIFLSKYILQASYYRVNDFFLEQSFQMPDELKLMYKPFNIEYTSSLNLEAVIPVNIGTWLNSNFVLSAYNEKYKSNDWNGLSYDRSKWVGLFMMNNSITLSKKPKISANLMLFYRTPTMEGAWDMERNYGANAGLRYSFLKDKAILSLQCNDIFESFYPKMKVRLMSQHQNINTNFYTRSITIGFTYKFNGYESKQHKEPDSSRFGIK